MFGDQNTNDKGWSESLVKDEFRLSMGKTPARNNPECWDNGNHKWVSISDMSSYARYTGDTGEYITDYAIADSGIKAVPKGTIIMSFKLSIGRTAVTSEDIYTNEAIMAFADFDEKKFNIDFLHFLIANKNWLLGAKQAVKGQTLNKESIGNAKIIIPPIEMQEQFACIYNQADKSKFSNLKSQFIEMFGQVSEESPCLNDIARVYDGTHKTPTYTDSGIPFISVENITDIYSSQKYISREDYELYKHKPEHGDIFMTRIGSIGKCAVYESFEPLAYYVSLALIKPNKDIVHPKFLKYYIESSDGAFELRKRSLLKAFPMKINLGEIGKIKVIVPAKDKQLEFVKIAEQADKSKLIQNTLLNNKLKFCYCYTPRHISS